MTKKIKTIIAIFVLGSAALTLPGCTKLAQRGSGISSLNDPAFLTDTTVYTHVVKNVSLSQLAATGTGTPDFELKVSVDVARAGFTPLTSYCALNTTNPCRCEMTWTETNTVSGANTAVARSKRLEVTEVQSGLVKCNMKSDFWGEIASGTTTRVNIVAVSPNVSGLNSQSIAFKKGTSTTANGDFLDDTLTPFRNIHRYTCYSKRQTSHEILNQYIPVSNDSGSTTNVLLASKFCSGVSGASGGSGQCTNPRSGFSSQSYYRNLFIRSDKLGEINSNNSSYDCPKITESIRYSAGQTIPSSEKGKYWPLDSSFALATEYSSEWSVGVRSGTILYKAGDANSVSDGCVNEDVTKRLNERGIIIKCLGYAKPPKADGTCSTITDSNGRVRPMTRLRRFRAIYPPTYKANGQIESGGTEADEVYVADRLVVGITGVPTGSMIYGPKPCNFAWFDHEGVTNRLGVDDFQSNLPCTSAACATFAQPGYVSTSSYEMNLGGGVKWSVNPDGLVLPTFDRDGSIGNLNGPSCSAAIPVVNEVMGAPASIRLMTSHQSRRTFATDFLQLGSRKQYLNEVHVKPIDPWSPNYVEDTSFQACAPVADPYLEPPLHFYKQDANTVGWCAKVYPTQNPYWVDINARKKPIVSTIQGIAVNFPPMPATTARVQNFTSHNDAANPLDSHNSCTGTKNVDICTVTLGSTAHADYADCVDFLDFMSGTRNTCDRTVTFDGNQSDRIFPLQAADADIANMLSQDLAKDRAFSCQFSVHADSSKVNAKIPLTGCCGIDNGTPIINDILNGAAGTNGHLEPFLNGAVPNIRFCGNPVEAP